MRTGCKTSQPFSGLSPHRQKLHQRADDALGCARPGRSYAGIFNALEESMPPFLSTLLRPGRGALRSEGKQLQWPKNLWSISPPFCQKMIATPINAPPAITPDAIGNVNSSALAGVFFANHQAMTAPMKNSTP